MNMTKTEPPKASWWLKLRLLSNECMKSVFACGAWGMRNEIVCN